MVPKDLVTCGPQRRRTKKEEAQHALEEENKERKAARVLEQMARSRLDKKGKVIRQGKRPPEAHLYKRNCRINRDGVDSYRHREKVLKPLLIPFVNSLKQQGRNIVVLEDNAPAHISHFDNDCFKVSDVIKMLWPANSPDANAIEQAWPWMRRHITEDYDISTKEEECAQKWRDEWEKLPIEQINAWIDSIPKRIIQILEQERDNNFHG
jgi:transposase